jgi:hypothetical protein
VRAVGVGVADVLHHGQQTVVIETLEVRHFGVEADLIVKFQHFLRVEGEFGPGLVVGVIRERREGVQTVVAASELHHNQDMVVPQALQRSHAARVVG